MISCQHRSNSVRVLGAILFLIVCVATVSAGTTHVYVFGNGGTLIGDTRIMPNSNAGLPAQGLNLSVYAAPNQYEAMSFVLQPDVSVSNMLVAATDLSDGNGHSMSSSVLDIKGVKVWYQADNSLSDSWYDGSKGKYLIPELLLKDLSLIRVNYNAQTNDIKLINSSGTPWYRPIDDRNTAVIPSAEHIYDTPAAGGGMQLFAVPANNNQQIWITVHPPAGQHAGNYTGQISVSSSSTETVWLNVNIQVLPFALSPTALMYGIYYTPTARSTDPTNWKPDDGIYASWKPGNIIAAELQDMKIHGIQYPTIDNEWGSPGTSTYNDMARRIQIQQQSGLPTDKLFAFNNANVLYGYLQGGNQNALKTNLLAMQSLAASYGYTTEYEYGQDEPSSAQIAAETDSFSTVIENGGKTFFAVDQDGRADAIASLTSIAILNGLPSVNTAEASRLRAINPSIKVLSYNIPQGGVENPEVYRKNYGLLQIQKGFDGAFIWAFNAGYGASIWNDYDFSGQYRNENFVYPATDGCIDTVQFEGLREGIDDTRFVKDLNTRTGSTAASTSIINAGMSSSKDMSEIRNTMIAQILATYPAEPVTVTPTPTETVNETPTVTPTPTEIVNETPTVTPTESSNETPTVHIPKGTLFENQPDVQSPEISSPNHGILLVGSDSMLGDSEQSMFDTFALGVSLLKIIVIVLVCTLAMALLGRTGLMPFPMPLENMETRSMVGLMGVLVVMLILLTVAIMIVSV